MSQAEQTMTEWSSIIKMTGGIYMAFKYCMLDIK
jgi:hypothetical protein